MKYTFSILVGAFIFAVYCLCKNTSPAGALHLEAADRNTALAEALAELQAK
jgi:hypothetical protein